MSRQVTHTRTVTVTRPDGTRLASVTQNGRALSETQHDSANSVVASLTRTYDAHGRVATETDSRGLATTYVYDNADWVTSFTRAGGGLSQTTAYVYDSMGRITETTLPDGGKVYQTYWPDGQLRRKSGAREYPSETAYDVQGRRVTLTTWQDYAGSTGAAVTTWTHDPVTGLVSQKLYTDGKGPSYTYTAAGRLLTRTWARDITTAYGYTVAGDPSTIDYSNTTGTDVTYTYDRQGQQTSITDVTGTQTLTYTAAGQTDVITYTGGPLDGIALDYAQDTLNRPAGYAATMGSQTVASASYGYDMAGRLGTVTAGDDTFAYSYIQSSGSQVGGIIAQHNNNPVMTTTKNYDGLNRLTTISQQVGTTTVSSHEYLYNQADQRTRATREDGAYWDYTYDALGQVIGGIKKTAGGQAIPGMTFGYSYDDIGNRKTGTTGVPAHESAYTANLLNQYTQRTVPGWFDLLGSANAAATVSVTSPADSTLPSAVHASTRQGPYWHAAVPVSNSAAAVRQSLKVTGVLKSQGADGKDIVAEQAGNLFVPQTPEAFTYDDDGNLLTDGRWTYTWDGENRLVAMETKSGIGVSPMIRLEFVYDAQSRRLSKKVFAKPADSWVLQTETRFLYDGWNLIAEFAVDPATQARTLKTAYVWGLDLNGSPQGAGGVGGLLASTTATGTTNYFYYDGNGNVTGLVNAGIGAVGATYEYDPFGNTLMQNGTAAAANRVRFSTKYTDPETGLLYYGYRYYSPEKGRWLARDMAGENSDLNLYGNTNNTVSTYDVLGLFGKGHHDLPERIYIPRFGYKPTPNNGLVPTTVYLPYSKSYYISHYQPPKGHDDFTGYGGENNTNPLLFDYHLEDTDSNTEPKAHPENHFRNRVDVNEELKQCCCEEHVLVERLMHQGQDSFVHYDNGYRALSWEEGWLNGDRLRIRFAGTGHAPLTVIDILTLKLFKLDPDGDDEKWYKAEGWTAEWHHNWVEFKTKCDK